MPRNTIVEVEGLKWKYNEGKEVLKGVDLFIEKGEFIGLTGPSGAGKTTLVLALTGVIPQRIPGDLDGTVKICGFDTRLTEVSRIARKVGVVFEDPETQFVMSTVEDEMILGLETRNLDPSEIRERVSWALELVGLDKSFLSRSPLELSGGEKQRVAIASVVALEPDVLILDEPTSDLDPIGKGEVFASIENLRKELNTTIIMVEHETEKLAEYSDRIVVLRDGKIELEGDPSQVFSRIDFLKKIGVKPPEVVEITTRLGFNLPALTIEEALPEILNIMKKQSVKNIQAGKSEVEYVEDKEAVLSMKKVKYIYPGGIEALKDVSVSFRRGEFVAVVGPNGSGKTTLAKLACGVLKPTWGTVLLAGRDIKTMKRSELVQKIGYVFQNPDHQLFCQSVREEIAFGLRIIGLPEEQIQRKVEDISKLLGINNLLDEHPFFLSKGERRRLALASVIALEPDVLIVDEPTTGQDYKLCNELMELLDEYRRRGKTVIVISHSIPLILKHVDRMIVMYNGRILADGKPRKILENENVIEKARLEIPQTRILTKKIEKITGFPLPVYTPGELLEVLSTSSVKNSV